MQFFILIQLFVSFRPPSANHKSNKTACHAQDSLSSFVCTMNLIQMLAEVTTLHVNHRLFQTGLSAQTSR